MENIFYVYEWFNNKTGEVFYVGKGKGNRFRNVYDRNKYFINYYEKYNCDVRKIKENLTESEAFNLEIDTIAKYRIKGECKCNLTLGGEGSTYDKNSWNDYFRRLQYLHDIKGAMDNMDNEDEYSAINMKTKSVEELALLYQEYVNFREGVVTAKDLGLNKKLDGYEMMIQFQEVDMLTKFLATDIAKNNKEFKSYLKLKEEIDFYGVSFDTDKFIGLILSNNDYKFELVKCISDNIILLKQLYYNQKVKLSILIRSFSFTDDNKIRIRFIDKDDKKIRTVFINIFDLVWGILMFKDKPMFQLILDEIIVAPFC